MAPRSNGGGFVQADLSPTETTNTVASPIDTYQQQSAGKAAASPGAQFLEGLGKLAAPAATAISNYDQQAGDEAEAQAKVAALTAKPEDLRNEIASGNYFGLAHRRAQSALRVMDASQRVFEASSELDGMKQRGELAGPEAEAKVKLIVGAHAQEVAGDPLAQKQFAAGMTPVLRKYTTDVYQANVQNEETNKSAQLYSYMVGHHDQVDRDNAGADADTVAAAHKNALFATADYAKNNLLMSPKAIKEVVGKAAEHYSSTGNLAAFDAVGRYDRDGTPLSNQYGPQWDAMRKKAETVADAEKKKATNSTADSLSAEAIKGSMPPADFNTAVDKAVESDPDNFGRARGEQLKAQYAHGIATRQKAAAQALSAQQEGAYQRDYVERGATALLDGNGYAIPETGRFNAADGVERTYARKEYQTRMYDRAQAMIDEQGKRENWDTDAVLRAKAKLYSSNGDVHPLFRDSFQDLYGGSRAGVAPKPESLNQRLGQLEFLRTNDPNQFANLASAGGKDGKGQATWLTAFRVARENGSDPERAYGIANQRVFNPNANERLTPSEETTKVDDTLKKLTGGGFFSSGPGILAGPIARAKAADAVQMQVAAGVADKDIAEKAAEYVTRNHIVVNGVPVHNAIPSVGDPSVASEYLKDAATFIKQQSPSLRNAPFGVALADDPARPGASYRAVRTDTGEPVSRTGISGSDLKDYVLHWREVARKQAKSARDAGNPRAIPETERTGTESRSAGIAERMNLDQQRRRDTLPRGTADFNTTNPEGN